MKILITGTHFTPAQAVIEELKKDPSVDIVYLGRKTTREGDSSVSQESLELPKLGVKFIPLIAGRLQQSFTIYTIPSLLKIPIGFIQSIYYLIKENPDVVLSFGGYIGLPVVIAAWLFSIPIMIHEQTLVSGLANTISAIFATKKAVSFKENLKGSNILTGNPLRSALINRPIKVSDDMKDFFKKATKEKKPVIYVTGGNQGSHTINITIADIMKDLQNSTFVIHQTGQSKFKDFDSLNDFKKSLTRPEHYLLRKWVNTQDLSFLLRNVSLVISRGGINTLYELAFFGIPTIAIPLPFLYQDEQNKNSEFFSSLGLVKVMSEKELLPSNLLKRITYMLSNIENYKDTAKKASEIVIVDAAKRLALETILLGEKNAKK